jgi:hypothetical protein
VQHIQTQLRRAKERLRHRTSVLRQCFAHACITLSHRQWSEVPTSCTKVSHSSDEV